LQVPRKEKIEKMDSLCNVSAEREARQRRLSAAIGEAERTLRRGFDEAFKATKEAAHLGIVLTDVDILEAKRALFFAEASVSRLRCLIAPLALKESPVAEMHTDNLRHSPLPEDFAEGLAIIFRKLCKKATIGHGSENRDVTFAFLYEKADIASKQSAMLAGAGAAAGAALGVLAADTERQAQPEEEEANEVGSTFASADGASDNEERFADVDYSDENNSEVVVNNNNDESDSLN